MSSTGLVLEAIADSRSGWWPDGRSSFQPQASLMIGRLPIGHLGGRPQRRALFSVPMGCAGSAHFLTQIESFGAFVKMEGFRKHGLVHCSQMANYRVEDVTDVCRMGDVVHVKVRITVRKKQSVGRVGRESLGVVDTVHGIGILPVLSKSGTVSSR